MLVDENRLFESSMTEKSQRKAFCVALPLSGLRPGCRRLASQQLRDTRQWIVTEPPRESSRDEARRLASLSLQFENGAFIRPPRMQVEEG